MFFYIQLRRIDIQFILNFMRKDSKLNAIQKDAQRVAEAISSSLELETEIVDERLTIVAVIGSGSRKKAEIRKPAISTEEW